MQPTTAKATRRSDRGYQWLRLVVALVLLVAAVLKGHQLATEPMPGHGLLDSRWLLIGVVEFELFFGLWLLAGISPKPTWAIALTCFTLFTCVSLCKAVSGYATCGCFGRVSVNPWYTTTLDLAIVLSLLRWRPSGHELLFNISVRQLPARAVGVFVLWLAVGLPAALAMGSYTPAAISDTGDVIGNGKIVVLNPETWVGKRFPLLDHIDVGRKLQQGKWLVLLYHHDCPICQASLPKYEQLSNDLATRGDNVKVALVETPPYGADQSRLDSPQTQCTVGRLSEEKEWFVATPLEIAIDRAVVTNVNSRITPDALDRAAQQDTAAIADNGVLFEGSQQMARAKQRFAQTPREQALIEQ